MSNQQSRAMYQHEAIASDPNVSGKVAQSNDRGVQLAGHETWFDVSRFIKTPIPMPLPGEDVTLHLNTGGYIIAVTTNKQAAQQMRENVMQRGAAETAQRPTTAEDVVKHDMLKRIDAQLGNPDALLRLRCLELAPLFIANSAGMPITEENVFALAERIERWARGGAA